MRRGPPRRGVYVVNRVRGRGGGGSRTRGESSRLRARNWAKVIPGVSPSFFPATATSPGETCGRGSKAGFPPWHSASLLGPSRPHSPPEQPHRTLSVAHARSTPRQARESAALLALGCFVFVARRRSGERGEGFLSLVLGLGLVIGI
jgi:hypothetical protein